MTTTTTPDLAGIRDAARAVIDADARLCDALDYRDALITGALRAGVAGVDIATATGLTEGRVSQLRRAAREAAR